MRFRGRRATAAAGLVLAAALVAGCSSSTSPSSPATRATAKPPAYPAGTATSGRLPTALAQMAFTDQAGHTVHLSDFAGRNVVVQDSMTLCQELCPIDTSALVATASQAEQGTDPDDTVFLTITVDPQRDNPAQLAAYRAKYVGSAGDLPQWRLLTGSPADVTALWKYLGVYVKRVPQDEKVRNWRTGQVLTYDVQHSDQTFFFDGSLDERYILDGMPALDGHPIPAAMQRFMSAEGHHNETKDKGWTADQALGVVAWLNSSPS